MRAERTPREGGERERGDREAHGEEREQRIELDRVLDLDERHAPDSGHGDERNHCHGAIVAGLARKPLS